MTTQSRTPLKFRGNEYAGPSHLRQLHSNVVIGVPDDLLEVDVKYWNDGHTAELHHLMEEVLRRTPCHMTFYLFVDYSKTVEVLLREGLYAWSRHIDSKRFPSGQSRETEIGAIVAHFHRGMRNVEVYERLGKIGLRPANIHELLTFGATHKNEQEKHPIVALGSEHEGHHPCLKMDKGQRCATLVLRDTWDKNTGFLAVPV